LTTPPILAELTRGGIVESAHRGWIAVARPDGTLLAHVGDPERVTFARSAMKPFQAVPLVQSGAVERFEFGDAQLAISCGSHQGEPRHRETVAGMLGRIGLPPSAMRNGIDEPWNAHHFEVAARGDRDEQQLGQNCSGKHAGMLAACVASGYPVDSYDDIDHPHQRAIRKVVSQFWDVAPDDLVVGRDGCTLPAYAAPLRNIATGWARIADPDGAPAAHRDAISRIADAMGREPFMVAGTDQLNTVLMETTSGRILAKDGAEGVLCMAIRNQGLGVTIKVEDGSFRSHGVIALKLLRQLNALSQDEDDRLAKAFSERLESNREHHVGDMRAVFVTE
jgi:L-asparaginase II